MPQQFTFIQPFLPQASVLNAAEKWKNVTDAWKNADHLKQAVALLEYLGQPLKLEEQVFPIKKTFSHGTVVLSLEIDARYVKMKAPFLNVEPALIKPLFRQALQINHEPLSLSRIKLVDDRLYFMYETPTDNAEPGKIYEVLKEICLLADSYDDTFIKRFKAERLVNPDILDWNEMQKKEALAHFRQNLSEAETMLQYFEQKRMHPFMWDVLTITLMKIDYSISPQGHIRSEIERGLQLLGGASELSDKIQRGRTLLASFAKMSDEEIKENFYTIRMLIPHKSLISNRLLCNKIVKMLEQAEAELSSGDAIAALLTIDYHVLQLLYYHQIETIQFEQIAKILSSTSGLAFQEAAISLISALRELMKGFEEDPMARQETTFTLSPNP